MIDDVLNNGLGADRGGTGSYRSGTSSGTPRSTSTSSGTTTNVASPTGAWSDFIYTTSDGSRYVNISDGSNVRVVPISGSSRSGSQQDAVEHSLDIYLRKAYRHDIFKGGDYASGDIADYAAYQTAVQQGKAITLANVMKSADSQSKMFYVPQGYYYVGANGDLAPKLNTAFVANTGNALTTTAATAGDDDTMLYLFLAALGVIAVGVVMKRKNKKKR